MSGTPTYGKKIEAIYAWEILEPDDGSSRPVPGIAGFHPMMGADLDRLRSYRVYAEHIRQATGCRVRLVRFVPHEVLEDLP